MPLRLGGCGLKKGFQCVADLAAKLLVFIDHPHCSCVIAGIDHEYYGKQCCQDVHRGCQLLTVAMQPNGQGAFIHELKAMTATRAADLKGPAEIWQTKLAAARGASDYYARIGVHQRSRYCE